MMPYNAYQISEARRQYMIAEDNRERLADIARTGNEKPSHISKVLSALQHVVHRNAAVDEQQTAPVSEVIPSATNS